MCEPLWFRRGEEFIEKAEQIYNEHKDDLDVLLIYKFRIKKAAFLKKCGYFDKAVQELDDL